MSNIHALQKKDIVSTMSEALSGILEDIKVTGSKPDDDITQLVIDAVKEQYSLDAIALPLLEEATNNRVKTWRKDNGLWKFLGNADQSDFFGQDVGSALLHIDEETLTVGDANLDVLEKKERHVIDNNVRQQSGYIRNMDWLKEAKHRLHGDRTAKLKDVLDEIED